METDSCVTKITLMAADDFIRGIHLCALCANTTHDTGGRKIDPIMLTMYRVVLPICDTCKSDGAKIVVGRFTHYGKAIQERLDQSRRREALAATSQSLLLSALSYGTYGLYKGICTTILTMGLHILNTKFYAL